MPAARRKKAVVPKKKAQKKSNKKTKKSTNGRSVVCPPRPRAMTRVPVPNQDSSGDHGLIMNHLHETNFGLFIAVEANIGGGKTDFCHILARVRNEYSGPCEVLLEPIGDPIFKRLLGEYYKDPQRWGFTFQMLALEKRFRQHSLAVELAASGTSVVQDRSIFADGCFGMTVLEDGNMTGDEWTIYAETFGNMKRFIRYPDVMVYLRTKPEVCFERMNRRARSEEAAVPLEYLRRIHAKHEVLAHEMARYTRVLVVDWNHFGADVDMINAQIDEMAATPRLFMRDFNKL